MYLHCIDVYHLLLLKLRVSVRVRAARLSCQDRCSGMQSEMAVCWAFQGQHLWPFNERANEMCGQSKLVGPLNAIT